MNVRTCFLMENKGFSLVELVVVIAIIGIISTIATIAFNSWMVKNRVETQVKQIATDINELRMRAMTLKQKHSVTLNADSYVFKSYSDDDELKTAGTVIPNGTHSVTYRLKKDSASYFTGAGADIIEIDSRGMLMSNGQTVYLEYNNASPTLDCLVISIGRVNPGQKSNDWSTCNAR